MKRYVLQIRVHDWDPWRVSRLESDTLEEAKAALDEMPFKPSYYRIAEAYIQVRYKAVKV